MKTRADLPKRIEPVVPPSRRIDTEALQNRIQFLKSMVINGTTAYFYFKGGNYKDIAAMEKKITGLLFDKTVMTSDLQIYNGIVDEKGILSQQGQGFHTIAVTITPKPEDREIQQKRLKAAVWVFNKSLIPTPATPENPDSDPQPAMPQKMNHRSPAGLEPHPA